MRKLTVDDIVDMRAYERERDDFRRHVIDLKRIRRVALGPIMTIVFENTETMRWQVQEMARAERMLRDEQIAHEVDTYNELIPDAGRAVGTLILELTSDAELREWLPQARRHRAATSRSVLADGSTTRGEPSDEDEAAPHPRRHHGRGALPAFRFSPAQVEAFASRAGAPRSSTIRSTTHDTRARRRPARGRARRRPPRRHLTAA